MPRGVAQQAFELERVIEQLGIFLLLGLEPRLHLERVLEREVASLLGGRIELHDLVGIGVGKSQHAPNVANRLLALDSAERDYLRDPVFAVLFADVVQDLVAPLVTEINVDIGHRLASRIEPALEQQLVLDRIELGDSKRVRHQAADHRAAARADRNAALARVADEIGDDQHVTRKAHFADQRDLAIEALEVRLLIEVAAPRANLGEPEGESLARALFNRRFQRLAAAGVELGEMKLAELEFEIDPPRDLDAVADRFGIGAEG